MTLITYFLAFLPLFRILCDQIFCHLFYFLVFEVGLQLASADSYAPSNLFLQFILVGIYIRFNFS
jgi:hypothetical protein